MSTKKDEGNSLYKKQKYIQAVAAYKQYVKYDHSDNSKAYNNMALCYFKMKQYKQCIQACEASIQLEPQFQKPYFRMYQAYKQLKDYYNLLITGTKFIKYSKQEKQIKQIQKQLIIYKQNLSYGIRSEQQKNQINKPIQQIIELSKYQLLGNSEVKEVQCSLQTKWQRIQKQIKQNPRKGINLAWRFISQQCNDDEQQNKYKKVLTKLKKANITSNYEQNNENLIQKSLTQDSSSSQSFQYLTASKQQFEPLIKQQQKKQFQDEQNKLVQNETKKPIQQQNKYKQSSFEQNSQNCLNQEEISNLFEQKMKNKFKNSNDQFNCFYVSLCEIIQSKDLNKTQKITLLMKIPQRLTRFKIFTNSLSKSQKQNLKLLSKSNNVLEIIQKLYFLKK